MEQIVIARILELESESINHLAEESLSQGFRFVERLIQDYRKGLNCFDATNSFRLDDGKLIIAFTNACIRNCSISFDGRNPVRYF